MDVTEGRRYRMHIKDVVLRGVLCVMDNGVWEVDGVQFRKEDVWLSEELLTEDFANNGDGTFSDTGENQLWSDNPSHFGVAPWNERPLPLGFRLPTLRELRTLFASTGFRRSVEGHPRRWGTLDAEDGVRRDLACEGLRTFPIRRRDKMRFVDNGDGTVTDSETGLVWPKDVDAVGKRSWHDAKAAVAALADGQHGLKDGSVAGDWRLPCIKELLSIIDYGRSNPALPSGHPFSGVQANRYWSGSTYAYYTSLAWYVSLGSGSVCFLGNTCSNHVWPVRNTK